MRAQLGSDPIGLHLSYAIFMLSVSKQRGRFSTKPLHVYQYEASLHMVKIHGKSRCEYFILCANDNGQFTV